jgi:hypothetical protein
VLNWGCADLLHAVEQCTYPLPGTAKMRTVAKLRVRRPSLVLQLTTQLGPPNPRLLLGIRGPVHSSSSLRVHSQDLRSFAS